MLKHINKYFHSMYYVTIAILLIVASIESITSGFPINLVVAVFACTVLDITIKKLLLKRKLTIPLSAIITGLIIGSVVPFGAPVLAVLIPSILAICSKFFIRLKGTHIFNPAVFGVIVAMVLFSSIAPHGSPDTIIHESSEASIGGYAVNIALVPLLIFASRRAKKLWVSIPMLIATALLFHITGLASLNSLNSTDVLTFLEVLPYYFAFIIASEPKTSPYTKGEQIVFGIGVAILSVLFTLHLGSHLGALIALLIGNLVYGMYRGQKKLLV